MNLLLLKLKTSDTSIVLVNACNLLIFLYDRALRAQNLWFEGRWLLHVSFRSKNKRGGGGGLGVVTSVSAWSGIEHIGYENIICH